MAIPLPQIFGGTEVRLTSGHGPRKAPIKGASSYHKGVDLASPIGTDVHSLASGRVMDVGYNSAHGNYVHIDHGNGYVTKYFHLNEQPNLQIGQNITNGQQIAKVGKTGISTGPHLHLALEKNGRSINPYEIKDLEHLVNPSGNQSAKTQVEPKQLFTTSFNYPAKDSTEKTENTKTLSNMVNPSQTNKNASQGTQYGTKGPLASEIMGKGIGEIDANELMKLAMNQGYSQRDARRAVKGLEKFKQLGADMVFDPKANRYNVIFKEGEDVRIDPRQGRKLGSNVAFGAADLIGLGRDVNMLASVISRKRFSETPEVKTSTTPEKTAPKSYEPEAAGQMEFKMPNINLDWKSIKLADESLGNIPEMDISKIESEPSEKAPVEDLLSYVLRRSKEDKESWDSRNVLSRVFAGIPFVEGQPVASRSYMTEKLFRDKVLSDIEKTKKGQNTETKFGSYIYGKGKAPKTYDLAPERYKDFEDYYQKTLQRYAPMEDPGVAQGLYAPSALASYTNVLSKIPGVGRLLKATNTGKSAATNKRYVDYITNLSRPKSPLDLDKIIIKARQANKVKATIERAGQINRMARQMGEGFEKGGKMSAASIMGLPKGQPGLKFRQTPQTGFRFDSSKGQFVRNQQEPQFGYQFNPSKGLVRNQQKFGYHFDPASNSLQKVANEGLQESPGEYGKRGDIEPGRKTFGDWLGDNAVNITRYTSPFIGESIARKELNVKPMRFTPTELMTGVVRDLPKNYQPMLNRVENRGSDLLTNLAASKFTDAYNRDKEFQYNMQNQMSKLQQQQGILDRTNQGRMFNAQNKNLVDRINMMKDMQLAEARYKSKLSPMLAVNQMVGEDISQKNYFDAFTKAKEMELAAKKGDLTYSELAEGNKRKGGKFKIKK